MVQRYSQAQRARIIGKIRHLRSRYPAMSAEDMAGRIADLRGSFDRKYFQRLEQHSLSDRRVHDIVEWITAEFDATFRDSFQTEPDEEWLVKGALLPSLGNETTWVKTDKVLAGVARDVMANEFPDWSAGPISVEHRFLTFAGNARLIRCRYLGYATPFDPYLIEYEGKVVRLTGTAASWQQFVELVPLTMNQATALSFADFALNQVAGIEGKILTSLESVLIHFESIAGQSALNLETVVNIFEPPLVLEGGPRGWRVTFDAVQGLRYRRVSIEIGDRIDRIKWELNDVAEDIVAITGTRSVSYSHLPPPKTGEQDTSRVREALAMVASSHNSGRLLVLLDHGLITLRAVPGLIDAVQYRHEDKILVVTCRSKPEGDCLYLASLLALGLRHAAAYVAGQIEQTEDIMKLAASLHALTLEGLEEVCGFLSELKDSGNMEAGVVDVLKANNLETFFALWREGAERERLYTEYARIYDSAQR